MLRCMAGEDVSIPVYHHTHTHLLYLFWGAEEWVGQNKP